MDGADGIGLTADVDTYGDTAGAASGARAATATGAITEAGLTIVRPSEMIGVEATTRLL